MPMTITAQGRPAPFRTRFYLPPNERYKYYEGAKRKKEQSLVERKGFAIVLDIISREKQGWKSRAFSLVVIRTYDPFFRFQPAISRVNSPVGQSECFTWTILWDIENVSIPRHINGAEAVKCLVDSVQRVRRAADIDSVRRIIAFTNVNALKKSMRNELQTNGVLLYHVETKDRKNAADKALITELLLSAKELSPKNSGICLISDDQDFAYPLASLRSFGFTTLVIGPVRKNCSTLLVNVPNYVLSFRNDVLVKFDRNGVEIVPDVQKIAATTKPSASQKKQFVLQPNGNGNTANTNTKLTLTDASITRAVFFTSACSFGLASAVFLAHSLITALWVSPHNSGIISVLGTFALALQSLLTWYFIQGGKKKKVRQKSPQNATCNTNRKAKKSPKKQRLSRTRRKAALTSSLKSPSNL